MIRGYRKDTIKIPQPKQQGCPFLNLDLQISPHEITEALDNFQAAWSQAKKTWCCWIAQVAVFFLSMQEKWISDLLKKRDEQFLL